MVGLLTRVSVEKEGASVSSLVEGALACLLVGKQFGAADRWNNFLNEMAAFPLLFEFI